MEKLGIEQERGGSEEPRGAGSIGGGLCSGGERDGGFCMETKARGETWEEKRERDRPRGYG